MLGVFITNSRDVHADEPVLKKVTITAYNLNGTMKNGSGVHRGAIAGRDEDLGKVAIIWERLPDGTMGEYIGTYEYCDTGTGHNNAIKKGYVVDVWCKKGEEIPTTKCWVQIVEADG